MLTDNDGNLLSSFKNNNSSESNSSNSLFKQNTNKILNNILPRKTYTWINDANALECYTCSLTFDMFNRKHHCRLCGRIFCAECSKYYVNYYNLEPLQLINREKYMDFYLSNCKNIISHRVCLNCKKILKQIKDLSHDIKMLELLTLDIKSYYKMKCLNKKFYNAVSIILSRIREIQYHLPGYIYNSFEQRYLLKNFTDILGHNKYLRHFLKILDKSICNEQVVNENIDFLISNLYMENNKYQFKKKYNCWKLMCCRDCNDSLDINDIIDIFYRMIVFF